MITGLFIRRRTIVARPIAVRPSTLVLSGLQIKCSDHICVRGLKSGKVSPQGKRISKAIDKRIYRHHYIGINKQQELSAYNCCP